MDSDSPPPTLSLPSPLLYQENQETEHSLYEFGCSSDKEGDEDDEFIQLSLTRELNRPSSHPIMMTNDDHWIKQARLDSILWILDVSFLLFGFVLLYF